MVTVGRERRYLTVIASATSAAAWLTLLLTAGDLTVPVSCSALFSASALSASSFALALALNPPAALLTGWALMLAAMMGPLLIAPALSVLALDAARQPVRAILLFVLGYATVWAIAGVGLLALALTLRLGSPNPALVAGLTATLALAWQVSPFKRRCLDGCRARPGVISGSADLPALRFGVGHGAQCLGSCWALMLFCLVVPRAHFAAMAVATTWIYLERLDLPTAPYRHRARRREVAVQASATDTGGEEGALTARLKLYFA